MTECSWCYQMRDWLQQAPSFQQSDRWILWWSAGRGSEECERSQVRLFNQSCYSSLTMRSTNSILTPLSAVATSKYLKLMRFLTLYWMFPDYLLQSVLKVFDVNLPGSNLFSFHCCADAPIGDRLAWIITTESQDCEPVFLLEVPRECHHYYNK